MIEIKNVSTSYTKGKKIIDNMNLKIEDETIFGFIGPNGAGKTTTLEMVTGVLQIDEGDILIDGKSIFESLNALYFSKDLKILLRMPIKSKDIVNGKLINMILSEYQMETIMLAIPMIVYGILTKAGALFYTYMIIILAILPYSRT